MKIAQSSLRWTTSPEEANRQQMVWLMCHLTELRKIILMDLVTIHGNPKIYYIKCAQTCSRHSSCKHALVHMIATMADCEHTETKSTHSTQNVRTKYMWEQWFCALFVKKININQYEASLENPTFALYRQSVEQLCWNSWQSPKA